MLVPGVAASPFAFAGEAIDGATETLNQLRELAGGIRLVTNTSSISRKEEIERN